MKVSTNTISLSEVRQLLAGGQPMDIIDVRTPAEFSQVHVRGARLIPLDELDAIAVAAQRANAAEPIYVICHSGGRAAKACERFEQAGISGVYSIEGGTSAWEKAGLPVERSRSKVISLERQVRIGAGLLVLTGSLLAWRVHPAFIAIPAFVGAGLIFAGISDYCGMGLLLAKMPWNKQRG